tara:strand:- start:169 stop:702 length:534 start_codon:yes stop_codon:yes gene_type:complete
MKYYRIVPSEENANDECKYGLVDCDNVQDEYCLEDGQSFPKEVIDNAKLYFEDDSKVPGDYQMMYFPWRLISLKLYEVLKEFVLSEDIVFYPVDIKYKRKPLRYFLMHFNKKIDAVDRGKSKYLSGELYRPILDSNKLEGVHILNFIEGNNYCFCVSEKVKEEMINNDIIGHSFVQC